MGDRIGVQLPVREIYLSLTNQVQHRYIWLPHMRLTTDGGVLLAWDDLRKILHRGQRMATVQKAF